MRVELVAVCNGARGVGRVRASTGSSSARPTTLEANTFQARVRSTRGPKRETRRHAANIRSRGTQFGNRRILFIEGHRQQRPWRRQTPLRCARAGDGFAGVFGSGVKAAFRRSPTGHLDPSRETRAGEARGGAVEGGVELERGVRFPPSLEAKPGKGLPPPSPAAGARRAPQGSAEHRAGPPYSFRAQARNSFGRPQMVGERPRSSPGSRELMRRPLLFDSFKRSHSIPSHTWPARHPLNPPPPSSPLST